MKPLALAVCAILSAGAPALARPVAALNARMIARPADPLDARAPASAVEVNVVIAPSSRPRRGGTARPSWAT